MRTDYVQDVQPKKRQNELLYRYGYFLSMLLCMMLASLKPHFGKTNGINSQTIKFVNYIFYVLLFLCCMFVIQVF